METLQKNPQIIWKNEGKKLNVLGHDVTVKLKSEDTNDSYVFEVITPAGNGIPPHVHQDEDEVIYVQSGEFEVMIGGDVFRASGGEYLNFIRHVPHAFRNVGSLPGKTLWFVNPGKKFEAFFEELGALPAGPPNLENVARIFGKYGMTILQQ